jgi:hypothetical protein
MSASVKAAGTATPKRGKTIKPKGVAATVFARPSKEREAAIERIVKAAGMEPDNRDKLAVDIERAQLQFALLSRAEKDSIKRIYRDLERLAEVINAIPAAKEAIKKFIDFDGASAALRVIKPMPNVSVGRIMVGMTPKRREPSTVEWFVGYLLAFVFEERFGVRAKYSDRQHPKGAYISFSGAVLAELGLHVDREIIARGFTRLSKDRNKRRAVISEK